MENKIATSVEQSEKLIELGIDKDTSDMYYEPDPLEGYCPIPLIGKYSSMHSQFPAWSLTALLELLPNNTIYRPMLYKGANNNLWHGYNNWFDNPLDAVFDMVCWLKENGKM